MIRSGRWRSTSPSAWTGSAHLGGGGHVPSRQHQIRGSLPICFGLGVDKLCTTLTQEQTGHGTLIGPCALDLSAGGARLRSGPQRQSTSRARRRRLPNHRRTFRPGALPSGPIRTRSTTFPISRRLTRDARREASTNRRPPRPPNSGRGVVARGRSTRRVMTALPSRCIPIPAPNDREGHPPIGGGPRSRLGSEAGPAAAF
jgi:hypothetical protein